MRKRRDEARLSLEPVAEFRIASEQLWKNLDGDNAIQAGIARSVHLAHAASAERRVDDVRPELGSGAKGHGKDGL